MKKYRPVSALAVQKGNQWLLVRKPRKKNAWQFPQGGVDRGEILLEAATRELSEECGFELEVDVSPESVARYEYDFPDEFVRHHGKFQGASVHFFKAQHISGEPKVDNEEIVEARWCSKKEIASLVTGEYWAVVKGFLEK